MKKIFIIFSFLLLSINLYANNFNFTKEEISWIKAKKSISVSNQLDWYPYDFNQNNSPKGFLVDYIRLLGNSAGLEIKFVSNTWDTLLKQFDNSQIDIMLAAAKTEDRENRYIFGHKIFDMKYAFVFKSNGNNIVSLESVRGKRLALVKGWSIVPYIKNRYSDIDILEFDTSLEALEAVAFDLADVAIDDYFTANVLIKENMLSNLVVNVKSSVQNNLDSLFIMAKKENQILISILDKVANKIDKVKLLAIKSKWISDIQEKEKSTISLSVKEKKYLEAKKEIKMCIDPDWMPLEKNENGKHIGMSSDYIKLLQKQIDIPINMVNTKTWLESIEFAKQRKCDIYSLVMPTPERKLYMNFTKPYLQIPLVLVTRNDEIFYSDVSSIVDKKIGIIEGYAYGEILRVKYPSMKLVNVKNLKEGLEKVEKNKLFGFIGTLATTGYQIQKNYVGQLKITGKFEDSWNLGIGTRNDEPLLLSIFEKAIASIEPERHQEILNKWISVNYEKPQDFSFIYKILAALSLIFLFIIYRQYELKRYNKTLKKLSTTDSLTNVYNRLKLDEILEYENRNSKRYNRSFCVVLLDIDDFKKINDDYGHSVGDKFLQEFANLLLQNKRDVDSLGRWGGEEFLFILPQTDLEGAHKLAQKIKEKIENFKFSTVGYKTASFGVAQVKENESVNSLFDRVDKALYTSKEQGKNRVTIDL